MLAIPWKHTKSCFNGIGGLNGDGSLPEWVMKRLDLAVQVLREQGMFFPFMICPRKRVFDSAQRGGPTSPKRQALIGIAGSKCMILCVGGGTPHKPAITRNGHVVHEAAACAEALLDMVL